MELANEVLNCLYLYNLMALTESQSHQSKEVRDIQGWILVGLCLFTVFINFCIMIREQFRSVRNCIRKWRNTSRLARKKKYVLNQDIKEETKTN
jgi:hypothetical protein